MLKLGLNLRQQVCFNSKGVISATCDMWCHDTTYDPFSHCDIMKCRRRFGMICRIRRQHVISSVVLGLWKTCRKTTLPAKIVAQLYEQFTQVGSIFGLLQRNYMNGLRR